MKSLGLSKPKWLIKLVVVAAASVLLIAFNHWLSLNYLSRSLAQQLRETLPNKIIEAGINESFHDSLNDYLVKRLNHDFAQLHVNSAFSAVQQCQAQVLRIHNKTYADSANTARIISLHWPINDHIQELKLGLACQWQWPKLIASQLFLSLLGLLMWTAVAPPLSPRRKQLLRALTEQGVNRRQAEQLSSKADDYSPRQEQALTLFLRSNYPYPSHYLAHLNTGGFKHSSPSALTWLEFALRQRPKDIADAIAIAESPAELSLCPATSTVIVHGYALKMSSTPFMYYLWYAYRRHQNPVDGWFTNPPSNRPDRRADQEIIALMQRYGGHAKAIKDLSEKGLRAKTLDQNRSKIKDELCQLFGEELAAPFLFESARDPQTARSQYRLALPATAISIHAPKITSTRIATPSN